MKISNLTGAFYVHRLTENARAVTRLEELGDSWRDYDVLGVDEGQFYLDVSILLGCLSAFLKPTSSFFLINKLNYGLSNQR